MTDLVERALLRMDGVGNQEDYCLQLDIADTGCWIIKFRRSNVIVNNRELIFNESLNFDASIKFKSQVFFWNTINGVTRLEDGLQKEDISEFGDKNCVNLFYKQMFSADLLTQQDIAKNRASTQHDTSLPLKSGWLLKKRDIINGWRSRYFVLYPGRLEYCTDQYDIKTKSVITLIGAYLYDIKRVSVNGVNDHYCLIIENKFSREKTTRVASELHGDAGYADIMSWKHALDIACHHFQSSQAQQLDTSLPLLNTNTYSPNNGASSPQHKEQLSSSSKDKPFLNMMSNINRKVIKTFDKLKPNGSNKDSTCYSFPMNNTTPYTKGNNANNSNNASGQRNGSYPNGTQSEIKRKLSHSLLASIVCSSTEDDSGGSTNQSNNLFGAHKLTIISIICAVIVALIAIGISLYTQ